MATVFLESFDKYGGVNSNGSVVQALLTAGEWSASGASNSIVAGLSATGFALSVGTAGTPSKTFGGNFARLIGGVRFSHNLSSSTGIQFLDGGGNQAGIQFNAAGTFSVRNGATTSGTILGTSTATVTSGSTHYLEWDLTFGNAGSYQLWLDGVSILSGSGDTTATANAFATGFSFSTNGTFIIDDLYVFDATGSTANAVLLTSPRIETTFPVGDSAVQFAVGAGILGSSVSRVGGTSAPAAGSLVLRRFTAAVAGTINSISIMPGATSAPANYRGVVYADSSGAPSTLLSSGTQFTGVTTGTVATLPLTTPQSLAAGTLYWIGFINDTSVALQQSDANTLGYRAANTYASGAPGTAPAMTSGQPSWLLWGNISITGANWNMSAQQPPPGLPSYVFDATVGHEDLYAMTALSAFPAYIHAVAVKAYIQKSDTGAKTVSIRTKSGSTDSGGSLTGQAPGTTFGWLASYFPNDPATASSWSVAALNAATAGVRVDS